MERGGGVHPSDRRGQSVKSLAHRVAPAPNSRTPGLESHWKHVETRSQRMTADDDRPGIPRPSPLPPLQVTHSAAAGLRSQNATTRSSWYSTRAGSTTKARAHVSGVPPGDEPTGCAGDAGGRRDGMRQAGRGGYQKGHEEAGKGGRGCAGARDQAARKRVGRPVSCRPRGCPSTCPQENDATVLSTKVGPFKYADRTSVVTLQVCRRDFNCPTLAMSLDQQHLRTTTATG